MQALRAVFVSMFLVVWAAAATAQPVSFARHDVPSVDGARGIATADFDRNGWPDVAHANGSRDTVSILLNSGGTLTRVRDVRVGHGPFDMVAADFTRDGIADLAVANADDDTISLLIGEGDGTFRATVMTATGNPRGITAADMNGDGRIDLVYTGYLDKSVNVVFGTQSGLGSGFKFVLAGTRPQGVSAADFNHDGLMDLAVAHESAAAITVLHGHPGAQQFSQQVLTTPTSMNVVATGDLDANGWDDIVAASSGGNRIAVYLGSPSGHRYSRSFATGRSPRDIVLADIDVDGAIDVITANRDSNSVSVLLGSGGAGLLETAVNTASGAGSRALIVADLDRDGLPDVGTANQFAPSFTVLSNVTSFERAAYRFDAMSLGSLNTFWGGWGVFVEDFNHDGRLDFAASSDDAGVAVLVTGSPIRTLAAPGRTLRGVTVDDVDGDGNADVVILSDFSPSRLRTYLGDGTGSFTMVEGGGQMPANARGAEFADLNGDGVLDVVFGAWAGAPGAYALHAVLGNGDGTFGTARITSIQGDIVLAGVGDLDRDGRADALVRRLASEELQLWSGDGTGRFIEGQRVGIPALRGFWNAHLGDLNHDGYPDVVVVADSAGVILNGPAGLTWSGPILSLGETEFVHDGVIADLDVDGNLDVVFAPTFIAFGSGDGTFRTERFAHGGGGLGVADVTADGLPDVLYGGARGTLDVLVNTRNGTNTIPTVSAGADFALPYQSQFVVEGHWHFAQASDPDMHGLTYEWRDQDGEILSTLNYVVLLPARAPGEYRFTVAVSDGRGGTATDEVTVTIEPLEEIVLHPGTGSTFGWASIDDPTAALGFRQYDPNAGAPKVQAPLADPERYVGIVFPADPSQTYKLWVRLKADRNSYANDSVWVQFSGAVDQNGRTYAPGTTSGLPVNLEECSGCGISGWGWEDDAWGAPDRNGVLLRFPKGGMQFLVIQTREDGVSIDQVVLSAEQYLTTRPGTAKNDTTILPITYSPD